MNRARAHRRYLQWCRYTERYPTATVSWGLDRLRNQMIRRGLNPWWP